VPTLTAKIAAHAVHRLGRAVLILAGGLPCAAVRRLANPTPPGSHFYVVLGRGRRPRPRGCLQRGNRAIRKVHGTGQAICAMRFKVTCWAHLGPRHRLSRENRRPPVLATEQSREQRRRGKVLRAEEEGKKMGERENERKERGSSTRERRRKGAKGGEAWNRSEEPIGLGSRCR